MSRSMPILLWMLCAALTAADLSAQTPNDEILAAFTKLGQVKSYRIRTTITPGQQYAQQMEMAKQMGLDMVTKPMVQEVVNPDTRRITMVVPMMSMGGMPNLSNMAGMKNMAKSMPPGGGMAGMMPKVTQVKMYGVSTPAGTATYMDCPECEKSMDESMRQQMAQQREQLAKTLLQTVLSGPEGLASAAVAAGSQAAFEAAAPKIMAHEKQELGLNRWECRGGVEKPATASAARPNFLHVKAGGTARVGAETAKTYQFSVMDEGSHQEMPMTLYVSASSGLPLKVEMSRAEGSMSIEFYDVNAPIDIPVPDCLKK
jgi:hypothetical protein